MRRKNVYYVYILASISRKLYIGVTNDMERRISEHKSGFGSKFCKKYNIHRLVHIEEYQSINDAIRREKELKGWKRDKKLKLIEIRNQHWIDFAN